MRAVPLLALLLAACAGAARDLQGSSLDADLQGAARSLLISLGTDAAVNRHSYFCTVRNEFDGLSCGGFIVNSAATGVGPITGRVLLTAAKCLKKGVFGIQPSMLNPLVYCGIYNASVDPDALAGQMTAVAPFPVVQRTVYGTWYPNGKSPAGVVVAGSPTYDTPANEHDFALMLLDASVGPPQVPSLRIPSSKSAGCKAGGGGVGCNGPAVAAAGDTLKVLGLGRTNPLTTKDDPFKSAVKLQQLDVKLNTAAQCASTAGDNSILPAAWSTNTRICAAGTPTNGATPGVCPSDEGGPLIKAGAGWGTDMAVGIYSYQTKQCGQAPGIYADLGMATKWIQDTITYFEATFFEYFMDILITDVNNAAPFAGPFQRDAQLGMSKFLTALLQKKGSPGGSPFAVDFYSFKAGRLRYKWTSKKTWAETSNFFTAGIFSANAPAANGSFSTVQRPTQGFFAKLAGKATGSYYWETLGSMEQVMMENIDSASNSVILQISSISVNNGFIEPAANPACTGSGILACKKSKNFPRPPN